MSLASAWLLRENLAARDAVEHTLKITGEVAALQYAIRRAESGQRGYLLTGGAEYLADYESVVAGIAPRFAELRADTQDDPAQQQRWASLAPRIDEKLLELSSTVDFVRRGNRPEAFALLSTGRGLALALEIEAILSQVADQERDLLAVREATARRARVALFAVNLGGGLLIAGLAGLSILIVRRGNRALVAARIALEATNAELERRVAERTADLHEANEETQRFAYIVTHDLRAPLVNIMGFTSELEAMRDSMIAHDTATSAGSAETNPATLRHDFDEAIGFIKTSTARMDRLINAILKLSRGGRREFTPVHIDLNELLREIVSTLEHRAQELGATISIARMPGVVSDRLALEQILSNLLDNALKYLRPGVPGRIEVGVEQRDGLIAVSVADNGRGIAERDRERVFELFRRAGLQDQPGEGIGLAHVRMLSRRIGGSVTLEARPGGGSVFVVTLPKRWSGAT